MIVWSFAAAGPALAQKAGAGSADGVITITQAKAVNGGVTPGDAPGFPVSITQPGSHRLAGNLTLTDPNVGAIDIVSAGVTLDLGCFTVQGPNAWAPHPGGPGLVCTFPAVGPMPAGRQRRQPQRAKRAVGRPPTRATAKPCSSPTAPARSSAAPAVSRWATTCVTARRAERDSGSADAGRLRPPAPAGGSRARRPRPRQPGATATRRNIERMRWR